MPLLKPRLPISSLLRPRSHQSPFRSISMTKNKMAPTPAVAKEKKQINLLRGWPNPSLLPTPLISAASQTALSNPDISIPGLLYGPDPGYQPLREEISRWMGRFYSYSGIPASQEEDPERICITGGASQNLACVLQVFSDPVGTRVWMVAPCYFLACRIFGDAGLRVGAVGEGSEGVDLEGLERRLIESEEEDRGKPLKQPRPWSKIYRNIIYCVPTFSNPSGKTMTLSCRKKLVQIARKYDALIITDDVYDCLQWPTSPRSSTSSLSKAILPRLVDVDRTLEPAPGSDSFGNAMSNGSFSKIAGPGVRTGWAEATPKFVYGLSQCGSSRSGGAPSQLVATMMAELLRSGELERHIREVLNPAYEKRYGIMMSAIQEHLMPLGVRAGEVNADGKEIFGGYFLWIELPKEVSAEVVADRAKVEENLIVAPGYIFEVENDPSIKFQNSLRLCFSWVEEKILEDGVKRLATVVRNVKEGVSPAQGEGLGKNGVKGEMGEFRKVPELLQFWEEFDPRGKKGYEEVVLKPPPNHWRWDQINFVFSEMGLEMPTPVEEKKLEEGEKEPVQMRRRVEQTGIVDWREWFARYGKKTRLRV